jgi:glycosyltransferase involved in cell wall biosynthesis
MANNVVAILLATYNSELYLGDLLDSLICQSFENWIIYIRDDNSNDNTISIINSYQQKHPNILLLHDHVTKRGATMSFLWLLHNVEADFYMFCDHDDVWLPNKIQITYDKMMPENSSLPTIVHTDLIVVDYDLSVISKSFWDYTNLRYTSSTFNELLIRNNITGCTMMINNATKNLTKPFSNIDFPHDAWIGLLVAFNNGSIYAIETPTILYRQHTKNLIGAHKQIKSFYNKYLENKKRFKILKSISKISIFKYMQIKILSRLNNFSFNQFLFL